MKAHTRPIALLMVAFMMFAFVGCGAEKSEADAAGSRAENTAPAESDPIDQDAAKGAVLVSYVTVLSASFAIAFGQEVPGVVWDDETKVMTVENLSLAQFYGEDLPGEVEMTGFSGTVSNDENNAMIIDLKLDGAPFESISYTVSEEQINNATGFTMPVIVDGRELDVTITESDLSSR